MAYATDRAFVTGLVSLIICYITQPGPANKLMLIYGNITLREPEFQYHCTIPWRDQDNPMFYWDTLCASAIELFGLPGDRYITDISEHSMTWSFCSPKDAVIFKLKFGEVVC